jgi:hypothetical protein
MVYFGRAMNEKLFMVFFTVGMYVFCCSSAYFITIWYIFSVLVYCAKKNLASLVFVCIR